MAANTNIGGLFATVNLDVSATLKELKKLETAVRKAVSPLNQTNQRNKGASKSADRLAQSTRRANREMNKANTSAKRAGLSISRLGRLFRRSAADTEKLKESLKASSNALSATLASFGAARSGNYFYGFSSGIKAVTRGLGGAGGAATVAGASIGALVAVAAAGIGSLALFGAGLKRLTVQTFRSGAELERLLVSFEALFGSAQRARAEFNFLLEAAKVSPYFTEDILGLDRFLIAQGIANDELRRGVVQGLIDFGSAAGLTGDKLRDLSYALGQVYNAGRLTGDEARQLRNNFLGAERVLRTLPRYADLSGLALKGMMEDGTISAQDFFEAFFAFTADFDEAAGKMQQTLKGLIDTTIDVFQLGLGQAAVDIAEFGGAAISPLEAVKEPLRAILRIVESIDFRPIVAALGDLVSFLVGPVTESVTGSVDQIIEFFEVRIPKAILRVKVVLQSVASMFQVFVAPLRVLGGGIVDIARALGLVTDESDTTFRALQVVGSIGLIVVTILIAKFAALAAAIRVVAGVVMGLWAVIKGEGWGGFTREFNKGLSDVADGVNAYTDAWKALWSLKPPSSTLGEWEWTDPKGADDIAGGGDAFNEAGDSAKKASGKIDKAAQEMAKAMDSLFQLTRRWFDLRSELEQGFLGANGFEATAEQIARMGQRVIGLLGDIADTEAVQAFIDSSTRRLIALAKQREVAATALADAERKLQAAIKERDSFAAKVKESALRFANAFRTETETVRDFQLMSERGFFYETESQKQKSFLDQLRERTQAVKDFFNNIKTLSARGLSENLLRDLIEAGPEAAGDAARQLAEGGDDVIAEVNDLNAEVTRVAEDLGHFGGQKFYQAGVDQARATALGLRSQVAAIEAEAIGIGQQIYEAILPFAEELAEDLAEAGANAGSNFLNNIMGGFDAVNDAIGAKANAIGDTITGEVIDGVNGIPEGMGQIGGEAKDEFLGKVTPTDVDTLSLKSAMENIGESMPDWMFIGWDEVREEGFGFKWEKSTIGMMITAMPRIRDAVVGAWDLVKWTFSFDNIDVKSDSFLTKITTIVTRAIEIWNMLPWVTNPISSNFGIPSVGAGTGVTNFGASSF